MVRRCWGWVCFEKKNPRFVHVNALPGPGAVLLKHVNKAVSISNCGLGE